jgi:hypothetical protein
MSSQWLFMGAEENALIRGASVSALDSDTSDKVWFTTNTFIQVTSCALNRHFLIV